MKRWLIAIVLLAAVAAAGMVVRARVRAAAAAMLPQLPNLSGQPPSVIDHVKNADAQARRAPASADATAPRRRATFFFGARLGRTSKRMFAAAGDGIVISRSRASTR